MLIRSLRAENFMKFRRLHVSEIPSRGLVGVIGRNEGGKTTIGELIQFALFGKTLSVSRGSILDLIHWDQDHCVVEVEFTHDRVYRVWREIDRYGTNYARLLAVDPDDASSTEEVASGAMLVAQELENRLGFSFEDFLRSFYLAERDFPRSPEKMRAFLDRMTGIEVLLAARDSAGEEIDELEERFATIQTQIRKNDQQISRYEPNVRKIPELEETLATQDEQVGVLKEEQRRTKQNHQSIESRLSARDRLQERLEKLETTPASDLQDELTQIRSDLRGGALDEQDSENAELLAGFDQLDHLTDELAELSDLIEKTEQVISGKLEGDGTDSFEVRSREEKGRFNRARRRRRLLTTLATLFFTVGFALAAVALIDRFQLQGPSVWIIPSEWGTLGARTMMVGVTAALLWLITALFVDRGSYWRQELLEADAALSRLSLERDGASETRELLGGFHQTCDREGIGTVGATLKETRDEVVREKSNRFLDRVDTTIVRGDSSLFRDLVKAERRVMQRGRNAAKNARKQVQEISERLKKQQSKRDRLQSEIREYQKQDGRRAELEEKNSQLRRTGSELREQMDVHHLAQELLGETVDSIRHRAGPSLGKGIRRLLPYLTDNRYQDLQVTPDFELRLFTGAKSDFLDSHELSGGTLEGLSFGFRLSFAQAFVGAVTRAPQFLFLDEPFRAMDRGRVQRTLEALHRLSDDLPQVIVVLPDLESDEREMFDRVIETEVGEAELLLELSDTESGAREAASKRSESSSTTDAPESEQPGSARTVPQGDRKRSRTNRSVQSRGERDQSRSKKRKRNRSRREDVEAPKGSREEDRSTSPFEAIGGPGSAALGEGDARSVSPSSATDDSKVEPTPPPDLESRAAGEDLDPSSRDRRTHEHEELSSRSNSDDERPTAQRETPPQETESEGASEEERQPVAVGDAHPESESIPQQTSDTETPSQGRDDARSAEPGEASLPRGEEDSPVGGRSDEENRTPRRVLENDAEDPSQFLAGIFDAPTKKSPPDEGPGRLSPPR